jgi:hypothetical protein
MKKSGLSLRTKCVSNWAIEKPAMVSGGAELCSAWTGGAPVPTQAWLQSAPPESANLLVAVPSIPMRCKLID